MSKDKNEEKEIAPKQGPSKWKEQTAALDSVLKSAKENIGKEGGLTAKEFKKLNGFVDQAFKPQKPGDKSPTKLLSAEQKTEMKELLQKAGKDQGQKENLEKVNSLVNTVKTAAPQKAPEHPVSKKPTTPKKEQAVGEDTKNPQQAPISKTTQATTLKAESANKTPQQKLPSNISILNQTLKGSKLDKEKSKELTGLLDRALNIRKPGEKAPAALNQKELEKMKELLKEAAGDISKNPKKQASQKRMIDSLENANQDRERPGAVMGKAHPHIQQQTQDFKTLNQTVGPEGKKKLGEDKHAELTGYLDRALGVDKKGGALKPKELDKMKELLAEAGPPRPMTEKDQKAHDNMVAFLEKANQNRAENGPPTAVMGQGHPKRQSEQQQQQGNKAEQNSNIKPNAAPGIIIPKMTEEQLEKMQPPAQNTPNPQQKPQLPQGKPSPEAEKRRSNLQNQPQNQSPRSNSSAIKPSPTPQAGQNKRLGRG